MNLMIATPTPNGAPLSRAQHGAVLIIMLLLLLVMTILGVSAMSGSTLEQRMAGNSRDRQLAFNAAEAALKWGEQYVKTNVVAASAFNDTNGLYAEYHGPTKDDAFNSSWWTGTNSLVAPAVSGVKTPPRVTIEYRGTIKVSESTSINVGGYGSSTGSGDITALRVTVRATGASDNTKVILTSYYGKRI